MRECGLKPTVIGERQAYEVTPHAGVWIETALLHLRNILLQSLPMRECGLKLRLVLLLPNVLGSLPMRECGLKHGLMLSLHALNCHSPCGSVD